MNTETVYNEKSCLKDKNGILHMVGIPAKIKAYLERNFLLESWGFVLAGFITLNKQLNILQKCLSKRNRYRLKRNYNWAGVIV